MDIIFLVTGLMYFAVRGMVEGVVMVKQGDAMCEYGGEPGPRSHVLFPAYHYLALLRDGLMIVTVITFSLPTLAGVLVLGWELFEVLYSITRFATFWPDKENLLGLGIGVGGTNLAALHGLRVIGGFLLLMILA